MLFMSNEERMYETIFRHEGIKAKEMVFSLEFKMKDRIDPEEMKQALKYAKYLDVIFGSGYEVIPALVLTGASDLYSWEPLPESGLEVPVCSGDMLFNVFDEFLRFLQR